MLMDVTIQRDGKVDSNCRWTPDVAWSVPHSDNCTNAQCTGGIHRVCGIEDERMLLQQSFPIVPMVHIQTFKDIDCTEWESSFAMQMWGNYRWDYDTNRDKTYQAAMHPYDGRVLVKEYDGRGLVSTHQELLVATAEDQAQGACVSGRKISTVLPERYQIHTTYNDAECKNKAVVLYTRVSPDASPQCQPVQQCGPDKTRTKCFGYAPRDVEFSMGLLGGPIVYVKHFKDDLCTTWDTAIGIALSHSECTNAVHLNKSFRLRRGDQYFVDEFDGLGCRPNARQRSQDKELYTRLCLNRTLLHLVVQPAVKDEWTGEFFNEIPDKTSTARRTPTSLLSPSPAPATIPTPDQDTAPVAVLEPAPTAASSPRTTTESLTWKPSPSESTLALTAPLTLISTTSPTSVPTSMPTPGPTPPSDQLAAPTMKQIPAPTTAPTRTPATIPVATSHPTPAPETTIVPTPPIPATNSTFAPTLTPTPATPESTLAGTPTPSPQTTFVTTSTSAPVSPSDVSVSPLPTQTSARTPTPAPDLTVAWHVTRGRPPTASATSSNATKTSLQSPTLALDYRMQAPTPTPSDVQTAAPTHPLLVPTATVHPGVSPSPSSTASRTGMSESPTPTQVPSFTIRPNGRPTRISISSSQSRNSGDGDGSADSSSPVSKLASGPTSASKHEPVSPSKRSNISTNDSTADVEGDGGNDSASSSSPFSQSNGTVLKVDVSLRRWLVILGVCTLLVSWRSRSSVLAAM